MVKLHQTFYETSEKNLTSFSVHTTYRFRFLIGQYVTIHGDVVSHVNISRVRIEDGGQYTCAVANRAGDVRHAARLNVYGMTDMIQRNGCTD